MALTPGCYIDSHHGHYAIPAVVEMAKSAGFLLDPFAEYAVFNYEARNSDEDYPHEALIELSEEAIEWLNHNEGLTGHWWGWNEGDFGLYPIEDED